VIDSELMWKDWFGHCSKARGRVLHSFTYRE